MHKLPATIFHVALLSSIVGGLAFASGARADMPEQPSYAMGQTSPLPVTHESEAKKPHNHKAMEQNIETRINTLHDKLGITSEQEAKWNDVAAVMRENETSVHELMKQRYENRKTMTAIDDLQSYESIAEAHTNGLKKMIPVFQALYAVMSDDQKKDADETFGRFEGHRDGKSAKKPG